MLMQSVAAGRAAGRLDCLTGNLRVGPMSDAVASSDRESARERYEHLLRCVAHNTGTGDPQPPAARLSSIGLMLVAHGSLSRSEFQNALQAGLSNGDLVRFADPRDGSTERVALVTEPDLVNLIEWLAGIEGDTSGLIGAANQQLQEVRD